MWELGDILTNNLTHFADTAGVLKTVRNYVGPASKVLAGIASLTCVFFIAHAGYTYMTSSGNPERMEHAKEMLQRLFRD